MAAAAGPDEAVEPRGKSREVVTAAAGLDEGVGDAALEDAARERLGRGREAWEGVDVCPVEEEREGPQLPRPRWLNMRA